MSGELVTTTENGALQFASQRFVAICCVWELYTQSAWHNDLDHINRYQKPHLLYTAASNVDYYQRLMTSRSICNWVQRVKGDLLRARRFTRLSTVVTTGARSGEVSCGECFVCQLCTLRRERISAAFCQYPCEHSLPPSYNLYTQHLLCEW